MKAAHIKWPGGEQLFENCEMGDQRVAEALDRLAKAGFTDGVSLEFISDAWFMAAASREAGDPVGAGQLANDPIVEGVLFVADEPDANGNVFTEQSLIAMADGVTKFWDEDRKALVLKI
jgi:hypothetical protein